MEINIERKASQENFTIIVLSKLLINQLDHLSGIKFFQHTFISKIISSENKKIPSTVKWFKALIYATRNGWTEIHHETSWTNVAKHLSRRSTCSKDQLRALRLLARAEMSHLHREIASFPYCRPVSLYRVPLAWKRERERATEKEEKRTRGVINLSAKRPRTSEASFRISQMRPWFSSDIP